MAKTKLKLDKLDEKIASTVKEYKRLQKTLTSLREQRRELQNKVAYEEQLNRRERNATRAAAMQRLRNQGLTLAEVGAVFGISGNRANQILRMHQHSQLYGVGKDLTACEALLRKMSEEQIDRFVESLPNEPEQ